MIKSAVNYAVSELFYNDANVVYVVPRYQREYSWGKWHWERLLDDILENNAGYFLGSIICINQSKDALGVLQLELVDGQQRLLTLSLLFAAAYHALKIRKAQLGEDQLEELINLKRKLVLKKGNDQIRVIPQIQNNNHDDYRAVLAGTGAIGRYDVLPHAGNRKIFSAFRYFQKRIEQMTGGGDGSPREIMDFLDKVNQATLVKIEVASHSDAYTLFESLNNRGMPLTAIDLIKNKLLANLERIEPGRIDHYFHDWNKLLGDLGDDYAVQERFFRHYYNAFREELKSIHQVPVATRSNLIHIYEKLIDHDPKECLQRITAAGQHYARLLGRDQDEALNGLKNPLRDLERIEGAPGCLLLLHLLMRRDKLGLSDKHDKHLADIVRLLVRFFVRRNLTDIPPTRDLTPLFMAIINDLAGATGEAVVEVIRDHLVKVSASDELFRDKLMGPIYRENAAVTRFVLCALAEKGMTKVTWTDLWKHEHGQFVWTIEHIFPQGDNIPQEWVTMMADGDKEKARDYQQAHVHKLGNLTISGYNAALGNKSFVEKRDRTDRQGRYVGYRNGLLNDDLVTCEKWSVEQIEARTKKLAEDIMGMFRLDPGQ